MNSRSRRHLTITALLSAVAMWFVFPSTPRILAQESVLKDAVYVSPTWGYSVRWYSGEWTLAEESTEGQTDTLTLLDALGNTVSLSGTSRFDGDAVACLEEMVEQVLATPGAADPETVEGDFGMLYESREAEQAYTLMQVRLPVGGALQDHAVFIECQTLVPGEAVFQRYYSGPVGVFDQWYDDIVETLEGVFLPASAWLPIPDTEKQVWTGMAPLSGDWRTNASLLFDEQEDPLLLVGLADAAGDIRVVTFENVSEAPVTIEPQNFALTISAMLEETSGPSQAPYSVTWDDGVTSNPDGSRVLQPGEMATVQVAIAAVDESAVQCDARPVVVFEYRQPESDQPAAISSAATTTCAEAEATNLSAPAAAGRPKLRLSR